MNEIKNEINYFFRGSYAYGTPNNDSDIDICIIADEDDIYTGDMLEDFRKSI